MAFSLPPRFRLFITFLSMGICIFCIASNNTLAQNINIPSCGNGTPCYGGNGLQSGLSTLAGVGGISTASSIPALIGEAVTFALDFILYIAVAAIIVAGIYLITSNGDDGSKDKAKNIIFYVVIGIILILFARVIVVAVNNAFGS